MKPHKPNHYDVIIVGAGPAGSACAYHLATSGLTVLVIDKASFPRHKCCAGGLTSKAIDILPYSIDHLAKETHPAININTFPNRPLQQVPAGKERFYMTLRDELDQYAFQKSITETPAEFLQGKITGIQPGIEPRISVSTSKPENENLTYSCRILVGCDGANSRVARLSGLFKKPSSAIALETKVPISPEHYTPTLIMDMGLLPFGYGWVFPKKDHLNVGLASLYLASFKAAKSHLEKYIQHRLGITGQFEIEGFPLSLGGAIRYQPESSPNILLAGDAAGLTEAVYFEGIYYAIRSGKLAARAILESTENRQPAGSVYQSLLAPLFQKLRTSYAYGKTYYEKIEKEKRASARINR